MKRFDINYMFNFSHSKLHSEWKKSERGKWNPTSVASDTSKLSLHLWLLKSGCVQKTMTGDTALTSLTCSSVMLVQNPLSPIFEAWLWKKSLLFCIILSHASINFNHLFPRHAIWKNGSVTLPVLQLYLRCVLLCGKGQVVCQGTGCAGTGWESPWKPDLLSCYVAMRWSWSHYI